MKYEKPQLEIEKFMMDDVICSSPGGEIPGEDSTGGDGDVVIPPIGGDDDGWL